MYRAWTRQSIEDIAREVYREMHGGGNSTAPNATRANNEQSNIQRLERTGVDEAEYKGSNTGDI